MFSRRPDARLNRSRVAAGGGLVGFPPGGSLQVAWVSPSDSATLPINTATTLTVITNTDASSVQIYKSYPTQPIGYVTLVNGVGTLSYTPSLTDHGSYTFVAEASRSASTQTANRSINVTAVALPGTWSTGGYWDARLNASAIGVAAAAQVALEGSGTLTPQNAPLMASGAGSRPAVELVAASIQCLSVPTTIINSVRPSFSVFMRVLASVGSARVFGYGNSGAANLDYAEVLLSSGKIVQATGRAGTSGGAAIPTRTFTSDMDLPSLTTHFVSVSVDGAANTMNVFYEGAADASNPQSFDPGAFAWAIDRLVFGARGTSGFAGPLSGQFQVMAHRLGTHTLADHIAMKAQIDASDLPPVVGAPIMALGDSLTAGNSQGGYRKSIADWVAANGKAIDLVGPYTLGAFSDNQHNGQGGNNMAAIISQQITPYIGSGKTWQPRLVILITGTNDVDEVGMTLGTLQTRYTNILNALDAAVVSGSATGRIAVTTMVPYASAAQLAGGNTAAHDLVQAMNAGPIQAIWDAYDVANPTRTLFRFNAWAALGSDWSAGWFGTDSRHPLQAGYVEIATNATHGILPAIQAYLTAIG